MLVSKVHKDHVDKLDHQELMVYLDLVVQLAYLERAVLMDSLEQLVFLANLAQPEKEVPPDQQAHRDHLGRRLVLHILHIYCVAIKRLDDITYVVLTLLAICV